MIASMEPPADAQRAARSDETAPTSTAERIARATAAAAGRGGDNWEELRAELLRFAIPPRYRPLRHLLVPSALGFAGITASLLLLRDVRAVELLTVPLVYLAGLGFEWRVHKDLLHRRIPPFQELYDRHERMHHVVFPEEDMGIRSPREVGLVLMPKAAIVGLFFMLLPLAAILTKLVSRNAGLLLVATGLLFFLVYEWMHLIYHLPATSWVGRRGWVTYLRTLHQRHHSPKRMKRWNFNVTLPVFDFLHRTLWSPEREAAREADRASGRAAKSRPPQIEGARS
jgi:sterol desaturase/sphingolipid hydroxylase (fatty acid hydroxylase superfamily)